MESRWLCNVSKHASKTCVPSFLVTFFLAGIEEPREMAAGVLCFGTRSLRPSSVLEAACGILHPPSEGGWHGAFRMEGGIP